MEEKVSTLRFSEFAKAALGGAIAGALAVQPAVGMAADKGKTRTRPTGTGGITVNAGNAVWHVNTNITFATTSSNWGFSEGTLSGTRNDAFDGAIAWHVNPGGNDSANGYQSPGGVVSIVPNPINPATPTTITGRPQVLAGLNVSGQLYFLTTKAVARSILILQNPTASPITVDIANNNNLGSDANTYVQSTSSGDRVFDATDNWFVSSQTATPGPGVDPVVTIAFQGPGSAVRGSASIAIADGNDNFNEHYSVTVPAGATRRVMIFVQMSDTAAHALTDAAIFNSNGSLNAGQYLAGLSATELREIVNWNLTPAATSTSPIPTLSEWGMILLSSLVGVFGMAHLRRSRRDSLDSSTG